MATFKAGQQYGNDLTIKVLSRTAETFNPVVAAQTTMENAYYR